VGDLLARARIETITSAYVEIPSDGRVVIHPHDRQLQFDRVVALPELYGPSLRGIPLAEHGFVQVDRHQRVPHSGPVYAAGDVTQFAIKVGGVASQQADAAAESIAALAGAPVTPKPLHPVVRAMLVTGEEPLCLSADVTGGNGFTSDVSVRAACSPVAEIAARYLAPTLARYDREAAVTR
jgi:sulfide:quinone oxidoreductase